MSFTETVVTASGDTVDLDAADFRARLAAMLREHRRQDGVRLGTLAKRSGGRFTSAQLRDVENGTVSEVDAVELAALYGADLSLILPARTVIDVDPAGRVSSAGVVETFDPDDDTGVLVAYLRLVRRLRQEQRAPVVALRRDDVEVLATVLDEPGDRVVDRLGALMGATRAQRRMMVGLFVSGAIVIGLAVTAVAATTPGASTDTTTPGTTVTTPPSSAVAAPVTAEVAPDPVAVADPAGDVDGDRADVAGAGGRGETGPRVVVEFPPLQLEDPPRPTDPSPPAAAPVPAPVPAPTPAPAPVPPTVAVGPPPVPTTVAPIVEPGADAVTDPPPAPEPDPAPAPAPEPDPVEPIVATGPPPIPTTTPPIPGG